MLPPLSHSISSGLIQPCVPPLDPVGTAVSPIARIRDCPMSAIFRQLPLKSTLLGLRSRCVMASGSPCR